MAAPSGGFQPRERRDGDQEQDWDVVAPKRPRLGAGSKMGGRRLIVVLEGASLETVKVTRAAKAENRGSGRTGPRGCGRQGGKHASGGRAAEVAVFWFGVLGWLSSLSSSLAESQSSRHVLASS